MASENLLFNLDAHMKSSYRSEKGSHRALIRLVKKQLLSDLLKLEGGYLQMLFYSILVHQSYLMNLKSYVEWK